jgi:alpha-L-arabinofuranosidase
MSIFSRRRFLGISASAALLLAGNLFSRRSSAQAVAESSAATTRIVVDSERVIAQIDRRIFGSFIEQLGRAVYEGIYDPGSPLSDARGFRKDVLEEIRALQVPIIRYPGGNFVSGYNWLDGVGPAKDRPRQLDKAWNSINTNQFGTNEFMAWCQAVGSEPLMALNLGIGTPGQAAAQVDYCNTDKGTQWSELRRRHGIAEPYRIRDWCLGNEMDGPWQIGHGSAKEYGVKARDAARRIRAVDPAVRLIACGSSGPFMPTYLEWDRQVLEECYDDVDALSLHRYLGNTPRDTGGSSANYLAMNLSMDQQIAETLAVVDYVRGRKRSRRKLWLSFDEWNVWYRTMGPSDTDGGGRQAPHLLEEVYNLEDALLVGGLLITLLRNSDRVRIGCLAQLVNVIAPIVTNKNGLLRQTIYYPYRWALDFARGAALNLLVTSPTYDVANRDPVAYVDAAATASREAGTTALFLLNRDISRPRAVEILWEHTPPTRLLTSLVLTGSDLKAVNDFEAPRRVQPQPLDYPVTRGSRTTMVLPAQSFAAIQFGA